MPQEGFCRQPKSRYGLRTSWLGLPHEQPEGRLRFGALIKVGLL